MHDAHPATWINNVPAQHNEQLLLAQHNEQLNNVPAQHIEQLLLAEHGTTLRYLQFMWQRNKSNMGRLHDAPSGTLDCLYVMHGTHAKHGKEPRCAGTSFRGKSIIINTVPPRPIRMVPPK
eukprot:1158970-Pelagomonas_calceolata.AAC.3